jgi:NAD(P)-dependent dehydrogenase (short-subunit alcohol dehydrogenase family)
MGKFALRRLAQSMARELSPQGIHVGHVVIDGGIRSDRRPDPARETRQHARFPTLSRGAICTNCNSQGAPGLGDQTAALGREVLDPVPRLDYNPDVLSLHLDCGAVVAATRLAKMLTLASQTDEPW